MKPQPCIHSMGAAKCGNAGGKKKKNQGLEIVSAKKLKHLEG